MDSKEWLRLRQLSGELSTALGGHHIPVQQMGDFNRMKLLKLEFSQHSGINTSFHEKKKKSGYFHYSQALCFSHVIWKMWEKKKKGHLL